LEVKRLAAISHEPFKLGPGMDRPNFDGFYHKWFRQITPHKKAPNVVHARGNGKRIVVTITTVAQYIP
jgi:hypothetical protein